MTKEELLQPRYKVIATWPLNDLHKVGDIIHNPIKPYWFINSQGETNPEDYPHLFKKLSWYEDRKPEDMPEYVKQVSGRIIPLDPSMLYPAVMEDYLPATRDEYLNQSK